MQKNRKTVLALLAALLLLAPAARAVLFRRALPGDGPPAAPGEAGNGLRRGALVDEVVFTEETDLGKAVELIERGAHHLYASGVSNAAVHRRVRDSARLESESAFGTSSELTINPAGPRFKDGTLNPFHRREIREALNWLVDRRYIAEEIYGGLAVPRTLPINTAFPDYARLAATARALELRYAHDPEKARAALDRGMTALGARMENGRWILEGAPARVRILIRTETERRRIGDYVAGLLEEAGFLVERLYRAADEASRIWIGGHPGEGRWHIYTGAWVSTLIQRDLASNFDFYYTRRGRPEPLWQAYEPAPEFDAVSARLQRRDYSDWAERQSLMARALELAMEDSVRVWLVDELNFTPRSADINVAADLAGGVSGSALWPYTINFPGRTGGRVIIGIPSILTEPWNPVDGTNWIFDRMVLRALGDAELLPDPFTGLYLPQRIHSARVTLAAGTTTLRSHDWLEVDTAPEIRVPVDAWIDWDAEGERFISAGERYPAGISARTRVRIRYEDDYFRRRWHDGSRVSPADLIIGWLLSFERAKEDSPLFDRAHVPAFEAFQRHYRGWRILNIDPLEIEVYGDLAYPDAEWIAATRALSTTPWHVMAVAALAERNGDLAFSSDKADRMRVEWLNLVAGPSLAVLEKHLASAAESGFIPFAGVLGKYLRPGEAEERYRALARWFEERGHFWVGDGPFYLHSVHPVERSVVLRRFADFPDPADKWLRFSRPPTPALELDGPMILEAGQPAGFELGIYLEGHPYPREDIETVRYLLIGRAGRLLAEGEATPDPSRKGSWKIRVDESVTGRLEPGAHTLEVAATSRLVALPAFARHHFALLPGAGKD